MTPKQLQLVLGQEIVTVAKACTYITAITDPIDIRQVCTLTIVMCCDDYRCKIKLFCKIISTQPSFSQKYYIPRASNLD